MSAIYIVNTDGDRVEFHDATFPLRADIAKAIAEDLAHYEDGHDFVPVSDGYAWMRPLTDPGSTEHIAFVVPHPNAVRVTTNSVERYQAIKARLEAVACAQLTPSTLALRRPWEDVPNAVPEETPTSRRVIAGVDTIEGF